MCMYLLIKVFTCVVLWACLTKVFTYVVLWVRAYQIIYMCCAMGMSYQSIYMCCAMGSAYQSIYMCCAMGMCLPKYLHVLCYEHVLTKVFTCVVDKNYLYGTRKIFTSVRLCTIAEKSSHS